MRLSFVKRPVVSNAAFKNNFSPNAGSEHTVSISELIELTNDLRTSAVDKIGGIQRVTGSLRMLALNAMIESARAGPHGHGFSVVAAEVREIAANVGLISEQLQKELTAQIDSLSTHTQSMNAAMGTRMVDLIATLSLGSMFRRNHGSCRPYACNQVMTMRSATSASLPV